MRQLGAGGAGERGDACLCVCVCVLIPLCMVKREESKTQCPISSPWVGSKFGTCVTVTESLDLEPHPTLANLTEGGPWFGPFCGFCLPGGLIPHSLYPSSPLETAQVPRALAHLKKES